MTLDEKLISLLSPYPAVVSFVGGGGKTTAIFSVGAKLRSLGVSVAVTTTTHMTIPMDADPCLPVFALPSSAPGKLSPPASFPKGYDVVLVEADGAKGKPLKAPREHEPVLPPDTTHIVAVAGLSAVGQPVAKACFCVEEVCRILGCLPGHLLTVQDLITVLTSPQGGAKGAEHRIFIPLLTQSDLYTGPIPSSVLWGTWKKPVQSV